MEVASSVPPATKTRIRALDHATLPVRDQFAAARFYVCIFNGEIDHLGRYFFQRAPADMKEGLEEVRNLGMGVQICDGVMLSLFEQDYGQPAFDQGHPHLAFAIGADEIDMWLDHLRYWGVPCFAYSRPRENMVSVYFNDLDGNHFELACTGLPEEEFGRFAAAHDDRAPAIEQWPPPDREREANQVLRERVLAARALGRH